MASSQRNKFVPFRSSKSLKAGGFLRQAKKLHMTAFSAASELDFP